MVSSADIFKGSKKERARDSLYRTIETDPNIHNFRFQFYSRNLKHAYQKRITEQEALTGIFNGVSVTLLRPSQSFAFNGIIEIAILEHNGNTVILTGEVIKGSLSHNMKFFSVSDDNPEKAINDIFSRLAESLKETEEKHPNDYERRDHLINQMQPIEDVGGVYNQKVSPLVPQ